MLVAAVLLLAACDGGSGEADISGIVPYVEPDVPEYVGRVPVICDHPAKEELSACVTRESDASPDDCWQQSDCRDDYACLRVRGGLSGRACRCRPLVCRSDADCAPDEACECGWVYSSDDPTNTMACYVDDDICGAMCIPADCRSDADCLEGRYCARDRGFCSHQGVTVGLRCYDPTGDDCTPGQPCVVPGDPDDRFRGVCTWDHDKDAWACIGAASCDS